MTTNDSRVAENNRPADPARPSPDFNRRSPPNANPHRNPSPHGGEVKVDDKFFAVPPGHRYQKTTLVDRVPALHDQQPKDR